MTRSKVLALVAAGMSALAAPGAAQAASASPVPQLPQLPLPSVERCVAPGGVALPLDACVVGGPEGGCLYVKGAGNLASCGSTPGRPVLCTSGVVPVPQGLALPTNRKVVTPTGKTCVVVNPEGPGACLDGAVSVPVAQSVCLEVPTDGRPPVLCTATAARADAPDLNMSQTVQFRNCTTIPGDSCTALAGITETKLCIGTNPEGPVICHATTTRGLQGIMKGFSGLVNLPTNVPVPQGSAICLGVPAEPGDCVEDGLAHLDATPLAGVASKPVHEVVEPLLTDFTVDLSPVTIVHAKLAIHRINCGVVVPLEDAVDGLLTGLGI